MSVLQLLMSRRPSIPDPIIIPLQSPNQQIEIVQQATSHEQSRSQRIEEFLQTRSLSPKTQKAYRQDLQHFLNWTDQAWEKVTPRTIAQFKTHLLGKNFESGQRALSDATVRRILGTLKNFYGWMERSHYVSSDPTAVVDLPKLAPSEVQNLKDAEVEQIYQAVAASSLPERNVALISVLLHGLRAEELSALTLEDYEGQRLKIRSAKTASAEFVPLTDQGRDDLEQYLSWRQEIGEVLLPESPLFVSHSRRNQGQRLGYDGIRKLLNQIAKQTGIDFHAHRFRHTFASNLVLNGMNFQHAMALTRHRSAQNFRRYRKAAEQLAAEATSDVD